MLSYKYHLPVNAHAYLRQLVWACKRAVKLASER